MVSIEKNLLLKKEIKKFSNIAYKLINGKENLEKLLSPQRQSLSKHGLVYNFFTFKIFSKTMVVKQGIVLDNACITCGDHGHTSYSCKMRLNRMFELREFGFQKEHFLPNLLELTLKDPRKFGCLFQKFDMSL